MIVAQLSDGRYVIGVDAENVRRLTAGQPMVIDLSKLGGTDSMCVIYGPTLDDVRQQLARVYGDADPIPAAKPMPPGAVRES